MTEPLLLATTTVAVAMTMRMSRVEPRLRTASAERAAAPSRARRRRVRARVSHPLRSVAGDDQRARSRPRGRGGGAAQALGDVAPRRRRRRRSTPPSPSSPSPIFSRVVVGAWFVGSDFFVPENKAIGDPAMALKEIGWGVQTLSGTALTGSAAIGIAAAVGGRPVQPRARRGADRAGAVGDGRRFRGPRSSTAIRSASATWCR